MPISRSASMVPPLRRSRSASMSSLAQVDLSTLDSDVVLDYARKVMHLQPQPATSAEKLQMLFALSQKLMKWFLEDRERAQKQIKCSSPVPPNISSRIGLPLSPLHIQQVVPRSSDAHQTKEADKPSVASRILASAVAPVAVSDIQLAAALDAPAQVNGHAQTSPIRPAEIAVMPAHPGQKTEQSSLQHVTENELPMESMPVSSLAAESLPQQTTPQYPQPDALQVYMQVQRSVICMQKYVRGFMARRRFFKALEELLQGRG
ncbi:hypothetical protein PC129_g163 [Phytophthora cactorum]|uniref:IQ motif, EF-hand binding site n=1 Tax=Phytophthora cactorum TaxID=29920 RepID=A0A329T283_9STRA|nr:hypothetical protein Pcac1_g161 [Phytophthora cactorum]KAG2846223.1 hypothetical protein PC112_g1545 [Phytophthora cactorum]KAG2848376.1 hypothetical protein PC111_g460 [Phytophthora cactorum]KAG2868764.1 hypothetical protein PC113_g807 [Phytophthora cactorum]KAG2934460.1 hypothetical protein PC114_g1008 [Phytophthora cactorum]